MYHLTPAHFALSRNCFVLALKKKNTIPETLMLLNEYSIAERSCHSFIFIVEEVT